AVVSLAVVGEVKNREIRHEVDEVEIGHERLYVFAANGPSESRFEPLVGPGRNEVHNFRVQARYLQAGGFGMFELDGAAHLNSFVIRISDGDLHRWRRHALQIRL